RHGRTLHAPDRGATARGDRPRSTGRSVAPTAAGGQNRRPTGDRGTERFRLVGLTHTPGGATCRLIVGQAGHPGGRPCRLWRYGSRCGDRLSAGRRQVRSRRRARPGEQIEKRPPRCPVRATRVLVVDDDRRYRDLLRLSLARRGYRVLLAQDALAG